MKVPQAIAIAGLLACSAAHARGPEMASVLAERDYEVAMQKALVECDVQRDRALTSCQPDASTRSDLKELRALISTQLAPFGGEGMRNGDVEIRFVGKARAQGEPVDGAEGDSADARVDRLPRMAMRAFNPATSNEFEITVPIAIRGAVQDRAGLRGELDASRGAIGDGAGDSPDQPTRVPGAHAKDWSGGVDDRVRLQPTTTWPWRTIADMGGCTATFIGPRHVITAGHCLYDQKNAVFYKTLTITPALDVGTAPYGSTKMPPKAGESGWYFVPSGWRAPQKPAGGYGQFDWGMVVVPDRLGDTVGWMGYGYVASEDLKNGSPHLLRGYPYCESETTGAAGNPERIDEPTICTKNAFYGGSPCSVRDFSVPDGDGFSRRVSHGCDASAANSGSAMYMYLGDSKPYVTMIHTTSTTCRFVGDPQCTATDTHPLVATRITPQYRSYITYFRNMFP